MECAILVGLQGSGKTTFYHTHLAATHRHVSKDNFPKARNRNVRQMALIDAVLSEGISVAIDNTNPSAAVRAPLIAAAKRHGALVTGYYFDADLADCLRRNRNRAARVRVPDVAIYVTARSLVPPTRSEGFDRLFRVRMAENDAFTVTEWENGS